jgi:ribosomal protein L37AE/L43A
MNNAECVDCGASYPLRRAALGYKTCLTCGDKAAREARTGWTISLAGHKQGYTLVTRRDQLKEVNKYANT